MKNIFLFSLVPAFLFYSCKEKDDAVPDAVACFTVDATQSTDSMHSFLFDQCATIYDLSYWDFDDGQYSSNPEPAHVFEHYGTYNVTLTATNSIGHSSSVTHSIVIGHYSLDKIVYKNTWTYYVPPITLALQSSTFGFYNVLSSSALLPFTVELADSVIYDMPVAGNGYSYEEVDSLGNFHVAFVTVLPSQVQVPTKTFDVVFPSGANDTAKFTLHYKLVAR